MFGFEKLMDRRRRAAGAGQVAKPNSSRAAGAGGSSNTMLKLYTDDSPGLRMYVYRSLQRSLHMLTIPTQRPVHCACTLPVLHCFHLFPPHLCQDHPRIHEIGLRATQARQQKRRVPRGVIYYSPLYQKIGVEQDTSISRSSVMGRVSSDYIVCSQPWVS